MQASLAITLYTHCACTASPLDEAVHIRAFFCIDGLLMGKKPLVQTRRMPRRPRMVGKWSGQTPPSTLAHIDLTVWPPARSSAPRQGGYRGPCVYEEPHALLTHLQPQKQPIKLRFVDKVHHQNVKHCIYSIYNKKKGSSVSKQ